MSGAFEQVAEAEAASGGLGGLPFRLIYDAHAPFRELAAVMAN